MEPTELFVPEVGGIKPVDFRGEYEFTHDGWPGTLTLHAQAGRSMRGSYRDNRFSQTFVVIGQVDPEVRHRISFAIRDFNWLDEQQFVGYLFTRGRQEFAGTTLWKEEPFGFVARKASSLALGTYRTGGVEPSDFAGRYDIHHDGWSGTLDLEHQGGRGLTGRYHQESLGRDLTVEGEVDPVVRHAVSLRFTGDMRLAAIRLTGYLFTRPKNAVAGVIEGPAGPTGFYMVKRG